MALPKLNSIFIVEDSAADRTILTDYLSKFPNVSIKGFFTGDACIKEVVNGKSGVPELILMDYFLDASIASKFDGLDTLVKIREICPETKVIMFTSVENQRIIQLAKEKGAFDYVVKGVNGFEKLNDIISNNFDLN